MTKIREKCEGCGQCCRAIYIPLSHSEFHSNIEFMKQNRFKERIKYESDYKVLGNMDDKTFVIHNWYPLTKEEVLERNPYLKTWMEAWREYYTEEQIDEIFNNNFYGCNQLDEETGRCMTHDNLPRVCSGYPWYEREPSESTMLYTEDCYYKRDLLEKETENGN
jgi:Fe-S-cluster containining protein